MFVLAALTQFCPKQLFNYCAIKYERATVPLKLAGATVAMFAISVAAPAGVPPFIYFQF
jgi:hypothetical protein